MAGRCFFQGPTGRSRRLAGFTSSCPTTVCDILVRQRRRRETKVDGGVLRSPGGSLRPKLGGGPLMCRGFCSGWAIILSVCTCTKLQGPPNRAMVFLMSLGHEPAATNEPKLDRQRQQLDDRVAISAGSRSSFLSCDDRICPPAGDIDVRIRRVASSLVFALFHRQPTPACPAKRAKCLRHDMPLQTMSITSHGWQVCVSMTADHYSW